MKSDIVHNTVPQSSEAALAPGALPTQAGEGAYDLQLDGLSVIVRSVPMRRLISLVQQIAKSNATVLIGGETGCGKEIVARAVHYFSDRKEKPFVDLNCASLPEHLVESELFGYEKGAFSGADVLKPGLFEVADTGTLFLDEIGDLDLKLQAKLLRVLDGAGYYRLGGNRKVNIDVRIVAATNQHIEALVASGKFRKDLYHRLAQFQLNVPPLRERAEDIIAIANYLLHYHCPQSRLCPDAIATLLTYRWPGNVRELKNALLKSILATSTAPVEIRAADLPPDVRRQPTAEDPPLLIKNLSELERRAILRAVADSSGNLNEAAAELGISRRTLERKLKSYEGIRSPATPLASMQPEQQRFYRAAIQTPITLRGEHGEQVGTTINVSSSGVGVTLSEVPRDSSFVISFELSDCCQPIEALAELAWCDPNLRCGIRFTQVAPTVQNAVQEWLLRKMREEGWTL